MRKAKPKKQPNHTARYLGRMLRAARAGKIIGFAAVVIHDGPPHATETWFASEEDARRLVGEVHMLNQLVAWDLGGPQHLRDRPLPLPRRSRK